MNIARMRKALAAALAPFLSFTGAGVVSGDVSLESASFWGAILAGVTGVVTYYVPNAAARE